MANRLNFANRKCFEVSDGVKVINTALSSRTHVVNSLLTLAARVARIGDRHTNVHRHRLKPPSHPLGLNNTRSLVIADNRRQLQACGAVYGN